MKNGLDFRIILVCCIPIPDSVYCKYRVYTNDGGFTDYNGFDRLPKMVKDFISSRNSADYVFSGGICISGCSLGRGR